MASIKKIEGKTGTAYKITVTKGRDSNGKQIRHFKTWTPDHPMTARQMEKEAQRVALDFEREIELGYQADNRQTFEQYARYVIQLREQRGAARRTIEAYEYLMERIVPAFGTMKLSEIRPQHLNAFYQNLEKPRAMGKWDRAIPKVDFRTLIKKNGFSQNRFAKENGMSHVTVERLCNGDDITLKNAKKIALFLGKNVKDVFEIVYDERGLTAATVRRYHGFISVVFAQAEKEMLIPYNPAEKASPPARIDHAPNYFQPDTLAQILEAAESEPMNWKTIIHILAVTGCRLGEVTGIKWEKINFEKKQIKIDVSLHYIPKDGVFEGPTKTKNTRYITIPDETVLLLKKYRAWQLEQRLKMGDMWHDTGYLFTKSNGEPIIPASVGTWLDRFSKRHGLPHINPHAFRHTAASILISEGVDIVTVSKMLGHANTSMTTDVYSHIIEESKRKATECIADVMLRRKKA